MVFLTATLPPYQEQDLLRLTASNSVTLRTPTTRPNIT